MAAGQCGGGAMGQCGGAARKRSKRTSKKKGSHKRAAKAPRSCVEQFTKKYQSRNSPAYPATPCAGMILPGKDGHMYKSMPAAGGRFYQWRKML